MRNAMNEWKSINSEDLNELLSLLMDETANVEIDPTDELEQPISIDLDGIDNSSVDLATDITTKLSEYFFDERYILLHPYIRNKIKQEMENIRRLIKMLKVNEKAQDILISNICKTPNKSSLFGALTTMQSSMLSAQRQLAEHIKALEDIFATMNAECEKTFQDKDKEVADDGSMIARGSKDFIKELQSQLQQKILSNV